MAQSIGDQAAIIQYIKTSRQAAGLTQEELAEKTGIPRTTIAKIEGGFRNTTLKTLLNLASALNIDLEPVGKLARETLQSVSTQFETLNRIEIKANNILHNFDFFQQLHPNKSIWPVLKSNAYGHGIEQITKILSARKCEYLVVDSYFEALHIWQVNPQQKVLLIGSTLPKNYAAMKLNKLAITVYDKETIKTLGLLDKKIVIHLKVNTGMNRQGIKISELNSYIGLIRKYPKIILEGVFSHYADADAKNSQSAQQQHQRFMVVVNELKQLGIIPKYVHMSATAGSATFMDDNTNAIRLGIGLYGYNPLEPDHNAYEKLIGLKPALRFISKIVNIIEVKKGEFIGYGKTFVAPTDMIIGTVPVGYYDGLDRRLSNKGFMRYQNVPTPIIGRISMNLATVDLTDTNPELWDDIEVIGQSPHEKNSVQAMSDLSETIAYDILVGIGSSTRRVIC
jgi:alanine racemase